eukprot:TRINITY_DN1412_c0_g1_i1.p2 TRINITY_DN1412_c0_g1~~TRINITY_DN1412_c0_g1_i1.p2  ORF type:complete len:234 (-),score=64.36 TRINITY_DN1412_c0_g1_i1:77-751(-)
MTKIKIFTNPICPFAHRATWAAKEKGLSAEHVEISLSDKPAWYVKDINPRGTVPTLQVDDKFVFESAIIAEYFEDAYKDQGTSLLPSDAFQRSQIRLFADTFGGIIPAFYALLKNQDRAKDEELKKSINEKLKGLVEQLKLYEEKGPFFLGAQLSLAEILTVPFLYRFSFTLPHYRQYDLFEADPSGRLRKWFDASIDRPGFKDTSATKEYYINGYSKYANPSA